MPLVDMHDMLGHAYRNGYAVGGFDIVSLEFIEAIVGAAEAARSPAILSLAESRFRCGDVGLIMTAVEAAARHATVPIGIHLDHGASLESATLAINAGCNGIMVETSREPFPENVARTRRVVEMAHACGVPVEGELGCIAGTPGEDVERRPHEVVLTSVEEARAYVERTGVDFLAVSIGAVHGRMRGKPKPDCERLRRINEAVKIPLVIRGGTGLSDDQFRKLIANGVAKIGCYTALASAAGAYTGMNAKTDGRSRYTALLADMRAAIQGEVEHCMRLWGSAGRAAEVLTQCRPWQSVQHVIIYNVEGATDEQVGAMMARGREILGRIPGVRRVVTGSAVQEKAKYRYCWLIEFVHPKVIDSYRDHPDHVAFANELFRPIAGDRISVDYAVREEDGTQQRAADAHRRRA